MVKLPAPAVVLAERQLGVIARWQLRRWLRGDQIDGLVHRRVLVRLQRGVYRLHGSAVVPGQIPFAAALRAGPTAVLTGPAVLGHLGVDGFDAGGLFEVLLRPGRRLAGVEFPWRIDPARFRGVTEHGAIRLTLPGDALVHSTRWRDELGDRTLRLGCHWLGWRGHLDRDAYLRRLVRRAGADPAAATMLEILGGERFARCESDGEIDLGCILSGFDPAPTPQVWLHPGRRTNWYFDLLRLAIEYDGGVDHQDAAAEAQRDRELAEEGVQVLHVTPADLLDEAALLARIVTALTLRALEFGVPAPTYDPTRRAIA